MQRRPIQVLPPSVAERIAAGEVIERPSSVVKELVENSLDAGATFVQVALEDGGRGLIEVTDDGHGMDAESLGLAVLRHATSKISKLEDLDALRTLGFRGEALPSISAVSELTLTSRAKDATAAFELKLGGWSERGERREATPEKTTFGHFLNSPHGTRIRAVGLFAQVPARLKFLKSQAAEVTAVREWLERLALAHPAVSFRLLSDGRRLLELRGESEISRVKSVLSPAADFPIQSVEIEDGGIKLRMHWIQGLSLPHSRKIAQVVNGRAIRDRLLQHAMLASFRQALLPGQFPAVALFAELDPSQIDVNAHPTKAEVRFLESRKVLRAAEQLGDKLLMKYGAPAVVPESSMGGDVPMDWSRPLVRETESPVPTFFGELRPRAEEISATFPAAAHQHELGPQRYVGSLFNTYLAYDLGGELVLVDQHAAHERIRYEALKKRFFGQGPKASQELLLPESARFEPEMREVIESRLDWLTELGFQAEVFGEGSLLFRAVPADWGTHELRPRLQNLIERLLEIPAGTKSLALDESLFEKLASEACHSSVRAGDRLERHQALSLIDRLFATEHPWNCPHGRPTVVRIPRGKLEEWFQRRV